MHVYGALQVFCFIMNEKGTSWAYATTGFGASLSNSLLRHMRNLTMTMLICKSISRVAVCISQLTSHQAVLHQGVIST